MNMKARIAALMASVAAGNDKYKAMLDRLNGDALQPAPKLKPTRRTSTTPGYASKYHEAKPNPKKKATKPFTGNGQARNTSMHGKRHHIPAPHIDEVRQLEKNISHKVRVRDGKCYLRVDGLEERVPIPLNAAPNFLIAYGLLNDYEVQGCITDRISHA